MESLKLRPNGVLALLALLMLAGIPAQASQDSLVVAVGPRNELLSGSGSGYNAGQWYSYPSNWHSQWFNNAPYDAGRKSVIGLGLSVEPLDSALPARIIITYGWSTPQWSALGRATPPLPGAAPEGTYIQRHVAFQGNLAAGAKPIRVEDRYEIRQYNPQWLSINVYGENFVITDGWIKHESAPRTAGDVLLLQQQQPECKPTRDELGCEKVTCPNTGDTCVPIKIRVYSRPGAPPTYKVLACACQSANLCHVAITSSGSAYCTGGCPANQQCELYGTKNTDGSVDYECRCTGGPQPTEACCLANGECVDTDAQTCRQRGGLPQGPGTKCLGDANNNGIDDACEQQPTQCAPTADGQGCLQVTCPVTGEQCVPTKIRVDRNTSPPKYTVLSCACLSTNLCHVVIDSQRNVYCSGGCPAGQQCQLWATPNPDGTVDYECRCGAQPEPTEACCFQDGTCIDTTANDCRAKGGTLQGPGTNCKTVKCPQPAVEIDALSLSGEFDLDIPGHPLRLRLYGTAKVHVYFEGVNAGQANDDDGDGRDEVQTELIELKLMGSDPVAGLVEVGLHPTKPSLGQIEERANNTPGKLDLPPFTPTGTADSFFDVFFEVKLPALTYTLYGEQPKRLTGVITHKPPAPCDTYQNEEQTPLVDADPSGKDHGFLGPVRISVGGPCEACCLPDGTCQNLTATACREKGGVPQGAGTDCSTVSCLPPGECDWNAGDPHKMHWPQLPDLSPTGPYVMGVLNLSLADDFLCTVSGPIKDIHIWGSFWKDKLPPGGPGGVPFDLSIWSNLPADNKTPYSRPGTQLWARRFEPGQYGLRKVHEGPQLMWHQMDRISEPTEHETVYQYNFCIQDKPFVQEEGKIYWLMLHYERPLPPNDYAFGWKATTPELRWNDDAVWLSPPELEPGVGPGEPLKYMFASEHHGETLDLAFVITGEAGPPPQPQACCLPDGTCQNLTATACREKGGVPQGPGTNCKTVKCGAVENDTFGFAGRIELDVPGLGLARPLMSGQATQRVYFEGNIGQANDDDGNGRDEVQTELVALTLTGVDPLVGQVKVGLHPTRLSPGQMEERANNTPGTLDLPPFTPTGTADSFFDVFFEVELPDVGLTLYGQQPKRLLAVLTRKHHGLCDTYQNGEQTPLVDGSGNVRAFLGLVRISINGPCEACCLSDGTCIYTTKDDCANRGGTAQGEGTDCSTVNCLPAGGCEWNSGDPHKMHFPQLPDLQGWDVDVTAANLLADDWKCSETGPVADIHFWYSWQGDKVGIIDRIHASIYSNIPAGDSATGHSIPGKLLWEGVFGPADFNLRHWATGNQGFIMGGQGRPNDHKNIHQCNICNIPYPFIQQAGQIYWLVLSITIRDPVGTHIGWKTSLEHFEDDAVYDAGGRWVELRDPRTQKSLDLAFVITGEKFPEPGIKWAQRPEVALCNMLPGCFFGWDELSIFAGSQIVADDWLCSDDRPITDIHWWGSFKGWASEKAPPQMPDGFHIAIWTDVPAVSGTTGFSHPGKVIWQTYCKDYTWKFVGWDVDPHDMAPPWEATFYFEYDLPEAEWFWQDPSAQIYWVSIAAVYSNCACFPDMNCDGVVDKNDIAPFDLAMNDPAGYQARYPNCKIMNGDADCDGDIDLADRAILMCLIEGRQGCCPGSGPINYPWGWKTRRRDPASAAPDDAVIILKPTSPAVGDTYQDGKPIYWPTPDRSWDMAFVLTTAEAQPECDWNAGDPHKMHWPQLPDLSDKGVDVDLLAGLADDFKCTATGPIKDIHFWGSFEKDVLPAGGPGNLVFIITIYSDVPASPGTPGWSMPGERLWTRLFAPGEYTVRKVYEGPEDWYDPAIGLYQQADHRQAYQYNFCIEENPFIQEEGKVYWLHVRLFPPPSGTAPYFFGWKTTSRDLRWNDDAVMAVSGAPNWKPLSYPSGHRYQGETLDLAFVITGGEEAKAEHDLGDAPDSTNTFAVPMTAYPKGGPPGVQANFPTVYRAGSPSHGPIHLQPRAVAYLGDTVSLENEADIGPDEDSINNIVPPNDSPDLDKADDGVQVPLALPHCQQTRFKYKVTVVPLLIEPPPLYVNVWLDWNRDGDWDDVLPCPYPTVVSEWPVQNQLLQFVASGTYDVTTPEFMCWHPPGTTAENPIWMRITLSEDQWPGWLPSPVAGAGGDGPAAGYQFGETEDYYFAPEAPPAPQYDFGDAPDPKYPTLLASNGARHLIGGPWFDTAGQPDPEPDGQPDVGALGDDNNGSDDEDGVEIPPLIQGHTAALTLHVNGGGGNVRGWIDFDGDGIWRISERIYNGDLPNGPHIINVAVPADAAIGQTFARFRISSAGGLGPAGEAADGEVEDYLVEVKAPPPDIEWPQWPDLTRNGINIRVDTSDGKLRTLADDFKCTSYKKVTDVHLWGSWKYDRKGVIKRIHLSIHADDPAGTEGSDPQNRFSQPDRQVLWAKDFGPGQFTETLYHKLPFPGEWWWDPVTGELIPGGDREVWQIDIYISTADAFQQKGSPDNPLVYWLDVQVDTENGQFGWKTRQWPDHYMDDAVWDVGSELPRLWKELRYPLGHPYYGLEKDSIDMAFVITGREEAPPPPPVAEHVKWSQPPMEIDPKAKTPFYCGWDELSFAIRPSSTTAVLPTVWNIVADDFRCLGSMPVTSVHWWGSYEGWDGTGAPAVRPTFWRIGFWSNVPANPLAKPGHSYPKKLLWLVDVPASRVSEERAGFDRFAQRASDTCFRYYVKFEPQEYFWQQKYIDSATGDDVFWISITAIYPPVTIPFQQWGWKTRPQHWMDDAVKFVVEGDLPLGYVNDLPLIFTPIEAALCGQQESFDMAFELDTDPSYIKWEQAFTGIRNWTHYADEESLALALTGEGQKQQLQIRRLVADDWPCEQITPITAAVWWGSYTGYRYKACDCPLMATPLKPDYFLLSIWTDVRPAANAPFSRPGEKIWEYKAENYDEVLVGYDKHPETIEPGQMPGYEPVFSYSVRLPRDKWFCQKNVNDIYWFSVVAVYVGDKTPVHPWGWTNHQRVDWQVSDPTVPPTIVRNDDAVAGYLDTTGATAVWKWQELHDQTGVSEDMSFILFTEPGCFACTYSTYADWLTLGKPNCWCAPPDGSGYQCDGDADGADSGGINKFRVFTGDLNLVVANWKKKAGDATLNPCADIDHKDSGGINKYRVFTGDLSVLVANWKKKDAALLGNCPRAE